jgi:tyrosinase
MAGYEKKDYIDAVKCLQSQPALNNSRPASWTRFDEFQAHHIEVAFQIHFVVRVPCALSIVSCTYGIRKGQFLPWHRQFLKVYETALREECGYNGTHPLVFILQ